jgi:mRNA interferase HicA
MKRTQPLKHLSKHGCGFIREGWSHSKRENPKQNRRSAIPRHNEMNCNLARKICRDPGIPFSG